MKTKAIHRIVILGYADGDVTLVANTKSEGSLPAFTEKARLGSGIQSRGKYHLGRYGAWEFDGRCYEPKTGYDDTTMSPAELRALILRMIELRPLGKELRTMQIVAAIQGGSKSPSAPTIQAQIYALHKAGKLFRMKAGKYTSWMSMRPIGATLVSP
jgi:hypothetical protein